MLFPVKMQATRMCSALFFAICLKLVQNDSMLFVETLFRLEDIPSEYIQSLQSLLAAEVPDLDWLKMVEQNNINAHTYYFIFLPPDTNAVVALAIINIAAQRFNQGPFTFLKENTPNRSTLRMESNGWSRSGFFSQVEFELEALEILDSYLDELKSRHYVSFEIYQHRYNHFLRPFQSNDQLLKTPLALIFYQKFNSYQEYLACLPADIKNKTINRWKYLNQIKITLGEYHSFQDFLGHGFLNMNELNSDLYGQFYTTHKVICLTLQKKHKLIGLVVLIPGYEKNLFVKFYPFESQNYPYLETVLFQMSIMYFLDQKTYNKLRFFEEDLFSKDSLKLLSQLGATPVEKKSYTYSEDAKEKINWAKFSKRYLKNLKEKELVL